MKINRRKFISKTSGTGFGLALGGILASFSAKRYSSILGANKEITVADMGINSRGIAVGKNFVNQKNCEELHVWDVDTRASAICIDEIEKEQKKRPVNTPDFRKALEDRNLDALIVMAPDHWHAPPVFLACFVGKYLYLEKPYSPNSNEGEMLVKRAQKFNRVIQMGNQRRSWPNVAQAITELHNRIIGNGTKLK